MSIRRSAVLAAAALTVPAAAAVAPVPAHAADIQYVTGPGSQYSGYTVPQLVTRAGDTVTYTNIDIAPHDVTADEYGPDQQWCADAQFAPGQCPRFWTPLISLGKSVPVYGLDQLKPGDTFTYHCSLHPGMVGTLRVLPA